MLKREKIAEIADADLVFLDDTWDQALLGFAESGAKGRTVLPCYGYQAFKAILRERGSSPVEIYIKLQQLVNGMTGEKPLVVTKFKRKELWQIIHAKNYPRWEQLDQAIIGLGKTGWTDKGIVYSKPLCITTMMNNQRTGDPNKMKEIGQITSLIDSSIVSIDLGPYTPWFVTPIA